VQRTLYDSLQCGILAHGFLRLGCDTCHKELLLAFSCKRRGFGPSCAGRRMAQTVAHLVEQVIPWGPTRPWVVSVPIPLRYWMAASQELTVQVHTIMRTTIGQYYVNQAVARGVPRAQVQPGSVTLAVGTSLRCCGPARAAGVARGVRGCGRAGGLRRSPVAGGGSWRKRGAGRRQRVGARAQGLYFSFYVAAIVRPSCTFFP